MQRLIARFKAEDDSGTHGQLETENCQFICFLLTLNWRQNSHGDWRTGSCIPPGTYTCIPHKWSENPNQPTWEITGVPDRDGILIHPANVIQQLRGCIAPGQKLQTFWLDDNYKITEPGEGKEVQGVSQSRDAIATIARIVGNGEPSVGYESSFTLQVINETLPPVA